MNALREAEAALGDLNGFGDQANDNAESLGGDNPWDDLQKELAAFESSGGFGGDLGMSMDTPEPAAPAAPSADDASIWNFGSTDDSSGSDDDMSGDMFSGFGSF